ncbi:glycosyltransferase [Microbacterium oryzae]|uniref:glycosyltransferase n=1 Tax=Microbacterium oryzae TaxID=743009 RepID=UPI0025AF2D1E|nr:glycosyltransferase [Microbacterium oryzae]MDN3310112.1 glycosyltransferase [Microbacterium oryzae]
MRRAAAGAEVGLLSALTALVDAGPPSVRFGPWRELRRRLMSRPLPVLGAADTGGAARVDVGSRELPDPQAEVVLVTGGLGTGGVETVIGMLARDLPGHGVRTSVLCSAGGATAEALQNEGIAVREAGDAATAAACVAQLPAGAVAQLHNAPEHLIEACQAAGVPIMPVLHTTDINLTPEQWRRAGRLTDAAPVSVAVSEIVRAFHLRGVPQQPGSPIVVIPNGVEPHPAAAGTAAAARAQLSDLLRAPLDQVTLFTCLARYDIQKNVPGLVSAFLEAAAERPDLHLIVAGPVTDWLEYRLARALCRGHAAGHRVHLMGPSDPHRLLAASDAFVLDSFFEGWAVASSEAVMAGIPVVVSDTGGAAELVGEQGSRGYLVGNPAGDPEVMSMPRIRRARRRTGGQENRSELVDALRRVHDDVDRWRGRRGDLAADARSWLGREMMVSAHAETIISVAARS